MALWIVAGVAVLLALWSLWLRDWLEKKTWPWSQRFFRWLVPWEITLWRNSRTIFMARLKMLTGGALTILAQVGQISFEPLMPFVPEKWHGPVRIAFNMIPMMLTVLGAIDEWLRRDTTKPLDLVAIDLTNIPEHVRAAIVAADNAKRNAVAEVDQGKAEGTVAA
jgi:hypothetical protein